VALGVYNFKRIVRGVCLEFERVLILWRWAWSRVEPKPGLDEDFLLDPAFFPLPKEEWLSVFPSSALLPTKYWSHIRSIDVTGAG